MGCDTATAFSIDSGDCTACGACFHTPNYLEGDAYDHDHECTITALQDGYLDVLEFNIESYFDDGMTVDGVEYDWNDGSPWRRHQSSSTISFCSDYSIAHEERTSACPTALRRQRPAPTARAVRLGAARRAANFHTPNYISGEDYDHDHDCTTALHNGSTCGPISRLRGGSCWYDGYR